MIDMDKVVLPVLSATNEAYVGLFPLLRDPAINLPKVNEVLSAFASEITRAVLEALGG